MPAATKPQAKPQPKVKPKPRSRPKAELAKIESNPPAVPELEADGAEVVAGLWYDFARGGQKKSLRVLRKVVNIAIPLQGGHDSRRRQVIDGAFATADQAGAIPLNIARSALRSALTPYFDVVVNIEAFNGVAVDVTVPTNVKMLSF